MRRLPVLASLFASLLLVTAGAPVAAAPAVAPASVTDGVTAGSAALAGKVTVDAPRSARKDRLTRVRLTLPASVGAIDGRLLVARNAATLMGVAVYGAGTALSPVAVKGGFAFGAYGLKPRAGWLIVDLVLLPKRSGAIDLRVLVDSASSRTGSRVLLTGARTHHQHRRGSLHRDAWPRLRRPPRPGPCAPAARVTEALPDGRVNGRDLDVARAAWEEARALGRTCGVRTPGDAQRRRLHRRRGPPGDRRAAGDAHPLEADRAHQRGRRDHPPPGRHEHR